MWHQKKKCILQNTNSIFYLSKPPYLKTIKGGDNNPSCFTLARQFKWKEIFLCCNDISFIIFRQWQCRWRIWTILTPILQFISYLFYKRQSPSQVMPVNVTKNWCLNKIGHGYTQNWIWSAVQLSKIWPSAIALNTSAPTVIFFT